jgi:hypothetical protein
VLERLTGRPPAATVALTLRDPATGATIERAGVPMRRDHRIELWKARRSSPFDAARIGGGPSPRLEVELDGRWHELLGLGGGDAAALLAPIGGTFAYRADVALVECLHETFEEAYDRPLPQPLEIELRRLDDGGEVTIADAPLRVRIRRPDAR